MQVMHFATVAHRVGNRVRLSIPGRRGDIVFFTQLEDDLLHSGGILSARANALAGCIVIRHTPTFNLDSRNLARFSLVCAISSAEHDRPERHGIRRI